MNSTTPTNARKNFYSILKQVNENHEPVEILSEQTGNNAIILSKDDWESIQETLYLNNVGVAREVLMRERDGEFIPLEGDIDWDTI